MRDGDPPMAGIYVDASALAKLYLPEPESDVLDAFLRTRRDLMISDLAVTEVLSAVARRRREGALAAGDAVKVRDALWADANSGAFRRLDLTPKAHRDAERLMFQMDAVALRSLDALHLSLALAGDATHVLTYDARLGAATQYAGLKALTL